MVVASVNEFRVNQKKYLDLAKQDVQVFLKRGSDLFAVIPVQERHKVNFNPVWVEHFKKAEQEIQSGKVTAIKSSDIWTKVRELDTP